MPMIPLGLKETKEIEMQEPFRVGLPYLMYLQGRSIGLYTVTNFSIGLQYK
jgi:hypothetical protein